ncbi:MAG: CoA transferase [Thermomicrobiales bacterium]|nr:CoA transferase [Thermomicrobiales bacterium]
MSDTTDAEASGALSGYRVIDLTQMLAGPLCGMRLGDLGADVIKVEPPASGEFNRTHSLAGAYVNGEATTFLALNRNKRSVAIDLKHPDGVAAFRDLVRSADALVQNFRAGVTDRLGIGYAQLREINPRLVYCSISGYGQSGPYRDRPGQDLVVQGYSGSMWAVGKMDDPPIPSALWAADAMTGYQAAIGILGALLARERTGTGQHVEVNMLSVVMDAQAQELVTYLNTGVLPTRSAETSAHAAIPAPYGVYETADGWITLAMCALPALGRAIGVARLEEMTDYDDGVRFRDEVYRLVRPAMKARRTADWMTVLDAVNVWSGPVYTHADLERDPHIVATDALIAVDHPVAGRVRMPTPPLRMSETPTGVRMPAPLLGEHTAEVLGTLPGYDAERIAALAADNAVRVTPQPETPATDGMPADARGRER